MDYFDELRPSFVYLLNERKNDKIIAVEIGNAWGDNAVRMLRGYENMHLTLVDINIQSPLKVAMIEFKDRIKMMECCSTEAAKMFPDEHFDYIYIDANHTYDCVREDLIAWYPKAKPGAIFAGHDWSDGDVKKAVYEWAVKNKVRVYGVETIHPIGGMEANQLQAMFGTGNTGFIYKTDWWMRK